MAREFLSTSPNVAALKAGVVDRKAVVGVIGLGYVGLPLALALTAAGFVGIGFDTDPTKAEQLAAGRSYLRHVPHEAIVGLMAGGRFSTAADFSRLAEADLILICVPTPLTHHREPDLSYVVSTTEIIARHLRPGQIVVLESTTYPGTTAEVMRPILEAGGLRSGVDFFLGYSPEREDPGNPDYDTARIPKVVGGDGPDALDLVATFYQQIVADVVPVSSLDTAEAVKLTENIFRAVNIALVNELKLVFSAMNIDIWEVIDAAKSKPFGFMPFYPGPGLGGHCIPIDPFYLTWKAREFDISTRFIELAGEVNTAMPRHVVEQLACALDRSSGRGLKGADLLIVGVAYKKNVSDTRESPAFKIMQLLEDRGARVHFHDPYVAEIPQMREHMNFAGRPSSPLEPKALADYAAALIVTDHDAIDYAMLAAHCPLVVDTRNACGRQGVVAANVVKA